MKATGTRGLVRRLLIHEADGRQDEDHLKEAAESALEKLRTHMSRRIGDEGVRTLLSRSLTLTFADFPGLATVQVSKDGSLVGLRETSSIDGAVSVLTHFLNLLVTFIGEEITLRMVGGMWPEFAMDDSIVSESEGL